MVPSQYRATACLQLAYILCKSIKWVCWQGTSDGNPVLADRALPKEKPVGLFGGERQGHVEVVLQVDLADHVADQGQVGLAVEANLETAKLPVFLEPP